MAVLYADEKRGVEGWLLVDAGAARGSVPSGFPQEDPSETFRRFDAENLVRAYCDLNPEAAFMSFYNSYFAEGSTEQNVGIMETSVDARQIALTANSETIYAVHPVNLPAQGGAVVVQVPAGMMGMVNAPGWVSVTDIGGLGPDEGRGGKYLLTAPGYDGEVPDGYFHFRCPANTIVWLLRGFVTDGDTVATVRFMKDGIRTYALADQANPPTTTFYNTSESQTLGHPLDTLYRQNDVFELIKQYFALNDPPYERHADIRSYLFDMGFFEGRVDPQLLEHASAIGNERERANVFSNRAADSYKWPGQSHWQRANNFVDEFYTGRSSGYFSASQHRAWSYQATFTSRGMTRPPTGAGSQYVMSTRDSSGRWLEGSNHYLLTIPANPPANDFWSVILYGAELRSMIQNEQGKWGVNSYAAELCSTPDGAITLYFAPGQPDGVAAANWIQTNPGEGFFVWFRTYGPTEAWYDGAWVLPDLERLDT
jgi:hypothetical protein